MRLVGGARVASHARSNPALLQTPDYKLLSQLADVHSKQQAMRQRAPATAPASGGRPGRWQADQEPPGQLLDSIYDALSTDVFFSKRGFVIPKEEAARINATGAGACVAGLHADVPRSLQGPPGLPLPHQPRPCPLASWPRTRHA